MDAFASVTLMEARSQGAITAASHPNLQRELEAASDAIRDECGWHIWPRVERTLKFNGRQWRRVWIPAMQITEVSGATIDGTEVLEADIEFDDTTGWTNIGGCKALVTYTAGFETVPRPIEQLTLEIAAAALGTSLGHTREQAGSVSVSFARVGGGLAPAEQARVAAYRIERLP